MPDTTHSLRPSVRRTQKSGYTFAKLREAVRLLDQCLGREGSIRIPGVALDRRPNGEASAHSSGWKTREP